MADKEKEMDEKESSSHPEIRVQVVEESDDSEVESSKSTKSEKENKKEKVETPNEILQEPNIPTDGIPFWVLVMAFLLGLTLGGGLVGGIFYFRSRVDSTTQETSTTLAPTPSPLAEVVLEEETEPEEAIDLSQYSLQVLNGTGKAGEAGAAEDLLTESGFEAITLGNSQTTGFTETVIAVKESVPQEVVDKIEASLVQYILEVSDEFLDESSDYDIVITVGSSRS